MSAISELGKLRQERKFLCVQSKPGPYSQACLKKKTHKCFHNLYKGNLPPTNNI